MSAAACLFRALVLQNVLPSADDLEMMCAAASCVSSLEALRELQVAHCAHTDNITVGYDVYSATYTVDLMLHTYKWACLKDTK
ncbi:hypothetical protein N0V88_001461 [Collariella sp. IMI 366227]|nr:hypothetical protein N0V88_001461 [Collariella sp. IMI 366227]